MYVTSVDIGDFYDSGMEYIRFTIKIGDVKFTAEFDNYEFTKVQYLNFINGDRKELTWYDGSTAHGIYKKKDGNIGFMGYALRMEIPREPFMTAFNNAIELNDKNIDGVRHHVSK